MDADDKICPNEKEDTSNIIKRNERMSDHKVSWMRLSRETVDA